MTDDFAIYVISNKRPNDVVTVRDAFEKSNVRLPWYIVLDDQDPTIDQYRERFGDDRLVIFPKQETIDGMDMGDNFQMSGSVVPRKAIWDIARQQGNRYFLVLDDDYRYFDWKFDSDGVPVFGRYEIIKNLDDVILTLLDYYKKLPPEIVTLSILQMGELMGGYENTMMRSFRVKRKAMNFFLCDLERPFDFPGRLNEDVNAYTEVQRRGKAMMMLNHVGLWQKPTQKTAGGMTETYLQQGTYTKSMYSVMRCPTAVQVSVLQAHNGNMRVHHKVNYKKCAPEIIPERYRRMT